jgi:hypothetical protein
MCETIWTLPASECLHPGKTDCHRFISAAINAWGNRAMGDGQGGKLKISYIVSGVALLAVIGLRMLMDYNGGAAPPVAEPSPVVLSDARRSKCADEIKQDMQIGLIRERATANRIDVDETLWAKLPEETKILTLAVVVCDAFGLKADEALPVEDYAVAYGWWSGKRLATLSSRGMVTE